jgi:hypothetical protein
MLLTALYYFIFCNEHSPDEFDVVMAYPKRIIPCRPKEIQIRGAGEVDKETEESDAIGLDTGLTFAQFGITVNQTVFVVQIC